MTRIPAADNGRPVLAFLKRRWILLSYAVVLLACSPLGCVFMSASRQSWTGNTYLCGVHRGHLFFSREPLDVLPDSVRRATKMKLHSPKLGSRPVWNFQTANFKIEIPLWFPLAAILAWIVFRELRWRETRAKREPITVTEP